MRAKDFVFLSGFGILILALLSPALWLPNRALTNFGDLYAYHYPLRHLVASGLQAGRLPFWNPYIFCGLPLAANPQAVLFYPVSILGTVLPLTMAFSWDYAFHLLWGGLGIFLLAKQDGLRSWSAALLSGLFCFSPFLLYRVSEGIPTLLASLSWAPWCWLALAHSSWGFLAAIWALQFLSGHPQFQLINALGMALWALTGSQRFALIRRMAAAGAGAAALALVQLPATWQFAGLSVRRHWPAIFSSAYTVSPHAWLTWIWPGAFGDPVSGTFTGPPSVFFETCGLFIGWAGLAFAGTGLASRRGWRAGLLVVLGAALSLGGGQLSFGFLRTPARYLFLSLWGLLLAVGGAARRWPERPALRAFMLFAAVVQLWAWAAGFIGTENVVPYLGANSAVARAIGGRPLRVQTDPELANANKTMLYRAMNVNGYEAFYLAGYPAFAAASEGRPAADASRTYLSRADTPAMRQASVAYRLDDSGALRAQPRALPLAYFADGERPLENGSVSVRIDRPERWWASGEVPPLADRIVMTAPAYPGWKAWLNGRRAPLEAWSYFQAVRLPQGCRSVDLRLEFRPAWWTICALAAAAAWLAWLATWRRVLS